MAGGIDPDVQLDYAEFELFPSQNRYEVCICSGKKVETVASGLLEQLLLHSPSVQNLYSKRLNASFKIHFPNAKTGAEWFTKSLLTRFLRIVDSPNILDISKNFENEISQLEETRKFQLSMNSHLNRLGSGETDDGRLNGTMRAGQAEVDFVSSDASKNELLRAMDLRLAALRDELAAAFCQAAGTSCSSKEITDLQTFSHYFGAMNIRNSLRKFVELSQVGQIVNISDGEKFLFTNNSRNEKTNNTNGNIQTSRSSPLDTPVKYGVSPAKVAQLERQSSTEESSLSSEDDQPSVERSRPSVRSGTPRRSASPMRRVQIGRSGSRRASAVTIKSLNHFSGRERLLSQIDAANSDEEGSEQPPRKSDNKQRISVQAAISLFENKQKDQIVGIQKMRSSLNASSIAANKSVLRRWSSGMSGSSVHCPIDSESSDQTNLNNTAALEMSHDSEDIQQEPDSRSGRQNHVDILILDSRSESSDIIISNPSAISADTVSIQQEESSGKFTASAEWSQKKEAELNQLLASMMESKPLKYQKKASDNQKKNVPGENRGGFYDHYKQKRDDKLRGDVSGKRAEKEAQLKTMQKFYEERKAEMASTNAKDVGRRHTISTSQKPTRTSSPTTKPKKEISKPAVVKKTSSKASLPATRKSWPSTPLPRTVGTSPAKTPAGTSSSVTAPKRGKPQPVASLPRSSPNMERPKPNPKTVKEPRFDSNRSVKGMNVKQQQTDSNKSVKRMNEKQQQTTKNEKITKAKTQTPSVVQTSTAKPSLYNKVTKKSSVVPVESKPFLRKGSRVAAGVGPVIKSKVSSLPEESMEESKDVIIAEESELVSSNLSPVCLEDPVEGIEIHSDKEPESQSITFEKCGDTGSSNQVIASFDDNFKSLAESTVTTGDEEVSVISPAAWVEMEEYQDESIMYEDRSKETAAVTNVAAVKVTSPRVRHSLSQMLLEETSECDTAEWGNAENPPTMVQQKDAPKGLKRLLKFARKSKLDASSGWSSPSGFSEGEDEAEESKTSKKNAENLLRKAALNAKNYGPQRSESYESFEKYSAQSGVNNLTTERANKLQEGHIAASVTTSKATRSFFSLSAFKGSKT
ncbi:serine/arginine repetitive matrix protein 1 [Heracleum sosnowskyi]|uniref:Serine/arginine repetitive matrix protein 1 n=1 Tax=Heracleum sosnowskyi TaxID=360622 RepID=A0AAD8HGF2_9APIA|nr:serine/arginine repetitive matrix protein 1 [Heracleum sosnowskyi]